MIDTPTIDWAGLSPYLAVLAGAGSVLGIILFVVVGIMLATSAVGFCPLYRALGLNTCGTPRHHVHG